MTNMADEARRSEEKVSALVVHGRPPEKEQPERAEVVERAEEVESAEVVERAEEVESAEEVERAEEQEANGRESEPGKKTAWWRIPAERPEQPWAVSRDRCGWKEAVRCYRESGDCWRREQEGPSRCLWSEKCRGGAEPGKETATSERGVSLRLAGRAAVPGK